MNKEKIPQTFIEIQIWKIKFFLEHWKLGVHLIFGTYHFGSNNQWWEQFPSMFGVPMKDRLHPIKLYKRYQHMITRAFAAYMFPGWQLNILFPRWAKKFGRI